MCNPIKRMTGIKWIAAMLWCIKQDPTDCIHFLCLKLRSNVCGRDNRTIKVCDSVRVLTLMMVFVPWGRITIKQQRESQLLTVRSHFWTMYRFFLGINKILILTYVDKITLTVEKLKLFPAWREHAHNFICCALSLLNSIFQTVSPN